MVSGDRQFSFRNQGCPRKLLQTYQHEMGSSVEFLLRGLCFSEAAFLSSPLALSFIEADCKYSFMR